MQPTLCARCKKNVAVVFISRMNEKNEQISEGLCLQCAAKLGLPQVEDMMKRMGITPEDLESLSGEMMQAFGGAEELEDMPEDESGEDEDESGKTATFPFLNRLFNNSGEPASKEDAPAGEGERREKKEGKPNGKRKFLEGYCISLNRKAKEGKLDAVIGREQEIERVVQILNRRQNNNPCLIGEPGVGKTPSPRAWPSASPPATCPRSCWTRRSCPLTSAAWWPAPSTAASLRSVSRTRWTR